MARPKDQFSHFTIDLRFCYEYVVDATNVTFFRRHCTIHVVCQLLYSCRLHFNSCSNRGCLSLVFRHLLNLKNTISLIISSWMKKSVTVYQAGLAHPPRRYGVECVMLCLLIECSMKCCSYCIRIILVTLCSE